MDCDDLYAKALADAHPHFESAFKIFLKAAKAGDPSSMMCVANMYSAGEGVELDYNKSLYWEEKALALGAVNGAYNMAATYRMMGDMVSAKEWYERALDDGDIEAALALATIYMVSDKERETVLKYLDIVLNADPERVSEGSVEEALAYKQRYEK